MRPFPPARAALAAALLTLAATAPAAAQSYDDAPLIDEGTGQPIEDAPGAAAESNPYGVDPYGDAGADPYGGSSSPESYGAESYDDGGGGERWVDAAPDRAAPAAPPAAAEGWIDPDERLRRERAAQAAGGAPDGGAEYGAAYGAPPPLPPEIVDESGRGQSPSDPYYALPPSRPAMIGPRSAWVVAANRRSLSAAIAAGLRYENAGFPAQVFRHYDGGYEIALGAADWQRAQRLLYRWRDSGVAEATSHLSDGSDYAERVWAAERVIDEETASGLR